jgi:hypothetical protein
LRRSDGALTRGAYRPRAATRHVLAYERRHRDRVILIALNLTGEPQELPVQNIRRDVVLSTYLDRPIGKAGDRIHLRANEGLVLRETV